MFVYPKPTPFPSSLIPRPTSPPASTFVQQPPLYPPRNINPCIRNQNKTNSAVQIKHIPTGIVVKSQATRSRSQNRKIARDLLALRLDEIANGAQSRTAIVGDVKQKKKASASKKSRRKYRKLAEEKNGVKEGEEGEEVEEEEVDGLETETGPQTTEDNTKPRAD